MNFSGYDKWKTTNPDDAFLGSAQQGGNPHEYELKRANILVRGEIITRFAIVDKDGKPITPLKFYLTEDEANDAIGAMIADEKANNCRECGRPLDAPCESCAYQRYRDGRA